MRVDNTDQGAEIDGVLVKHAAPVREVAADVIERKIHPSDIDNVHERSPVSQTSGVVVYPPGRDEDVRCWLSIGGELIEVNTKNELAGLVRDL